MRFKDVLHVGTQEENAQEWDKEPGSRSTKWSQLPCAAHHQGSEHNKPTTTAAMIIYWALSKHQALYHINPCNPPANTGK